MAVSESSLLRISYGALVFAMSVVIGFTLWLSAINEKAQANTINLHELRNDKHVELDLLRALSDRTARIEGILEAMMSRKEEGE